MDIGYKQRGDTKCNRSKLIRRMFACIGQPNSQVISIPTSSENEIYQPDTSEYEKGAIEEEMEETVYETDKQIEARGLGKVNPNSLIGKLELLTLETKAVHDGLYDDILNLSKQLLSMNIISQEQQDNFDFNFNK